MDFSQQELPITAFFGRAHKKKDNERPTRSTTKRRCQATEASPTENEKGDIASSSKDLLNTYIQPSSRKASGSNHRSIASGKAPRASAHEKASPEVLDLTSPSPERQTNSSASKRRKLDVILPTPPSTRARKLHHIPAPIAERQRNFRGALPTPATSVPRRPQDRVMQTPSSPLAPRPGIAKARLRSSSPLTSCPSDDDVEGLHEIGARSHAAVAQALLNVAPAMPDKTVTYAHEAEGDSSGSMFANPAAGEILVPSSPLPIKDMPPPSNLYAPRHHNSSDGPRIDTSPVITSITNLPYLTTEPTAIESSQSQVLLPFQDSPRRNRILPVSFIPSSQSQIPLPFWDSPRRQKRIFTPNAYNNSGTDMDEIIPSSQSQDLDEMYMGMHLSQLGLHELPTFYDSMDDDARSQNIDAENESSLPESFPLTPRNKRASRWRELNLSPEKRQEQPGEWHSGDAIPVHSNIGEIKLPDSRGLTHTNDVVECLAPNESVSYRRDLIPPSPPRNPNEDYIDYDADNSLSFQSAPNFSSQYNQTSGSSLSDDTQALMLAGAPPGSSQPSGQEWGTGLSDDSIPSVVREFVDMFDDDGSYPADFPAHLRC